MLLRSFFYAFIVLLNFLNHGSSMEADDIGDRFFKCNLSTHEQENLNPQQLLNYILKYSYLDDYQCINAGLEGFFDTLAGRGWLIITKGTPPGKHDAHFDVITGYTITNEAEVKKYLQEHYTSMQEYQKYAHLEGRSGPEGEDDGS